MKKERVRIVLLFLFSVLFVYGLSCFSVYESYDVFFPTFFSGALSEGVPMNIFHFIAHFVLAEIYMKFYTVIPGIPWYEIFLFFYIAVSLFTIIFILFKRNVQSGTKAKILIVLLSFILSTEFILCFQFTRVAFALGIASTLAMLLGGKDNKILAWWSCGLFIFCLLTRHETGIFIFLIQWLGALFVSNDTYSKVALWFNTCALLLVAGYIFYDQLTTTDFPKQFEPELGYQLLDRGNIVPLNSMTNAVDSAKYIAAINLIADQDYITIPFLRSLVATNAFVGVNEKLIQKAIETMYDMLNHSFGLLIIYFGLLLLAVRQSLASGKKIFFKLLLFNASFWLIIVTVTYLIYLQYYISDMMLVLMCFVLLSKIDFDSLRTMYIAGGFSCLIILSGMVVLYHKQQEYRQHLTRNLEPNAKFRDELKRKYSGKILVPSNEQKKMIWFSLRPYQMHDFSVFSRFYLFDADLTYLEPPYNAYLRKECKCNVRGYTDFMDFLDSKKDSVRIISSPERIEVIKYYCRVVRGKNYNIIPIDSLSIDGNSATIFTFK